MKTYWGSPPLARLHVLVPKWRFTFTMTTGWSEPLPSIHYSNPIRPQCWSMIPPAADWKLLGEWSFNSGQGSKWALKKYQASISAPPLSYSSVSVVVTSPLMYSITTLFHRECLGCFPSVGCSYMHPDEGDWVLYFLLSVIISHENRYDQKFPR